MKNHIALLLMSLLVVVPALNAKVTTVRKQSAFGHEVKKNPPKESALKKFRRKRKEKNPGKPLNAGYRASIDLIEENKPEQPAPVKAKKRIVVFTSNGGGGHNAVAKGLNAYLSDDYDITIINVFQDILSPTDTIGTLTFGRIRAEDVYNFCLRCHWTNAIGKYAHAGTGYYRWRQQDIEKLIMDYFRFVKPDLIISVVPFVNGATLNVVKKLEIPLLVLTNDLDTTNYVVGIDKPDYERFRYALSFDDTSLKAKIKHAHIPYKQMVVTGFPLRPEFFKEKNKTALKKEFKIPKDKPVIMVFMGGAGSQASYRYVRTLSKMNMPMHIICCLGRNERLKINIKKIALPDDVTITVMGFTDRIADLMAISDLLITKPGPNSVCEALESCLPMILDQTSGTIWWEQMNVDYMIEHGFGESLTNFKDLPTLLKKYIKDDKYVSKLKRKMKKFKRERFEEKIKLLVEEMLFL